MQIRQWVNNNSAVATILAVVLLIVAVLVIFKTIGPTTGRGFSQYQYYYDIESRDRFKDDFTKVPPFETSTGGTGVYALFYSCDDCDDNWQVAFLRKYSKRAKQLKEDYERKMRESMESGNPMPAVMMPGVGGGGVWEREQFVSRVDPIKWVPIDSEEGRKIFSVWRNACGGEKAEICRPR